MKSPRILAQGISVTLRPTLLALLVLSPAVTFGDLKTIVAAGDPTLNPSGSTPNWGTAANWSPAGVPVLTDNVVISNTGATAAGIDLRASSLTPVGVAVIQDLEFSGAGTGAVRLQNNSTGSSGTLTLNGGRGAGIPLIQSGSYAVTIANTGVGNPTRTLTVLLGASGTISAGAGGLTISAALTEAGDAQSLTTSGPGLLTLSGASTFTGGLTHSAGLLRATGNVNALGLGTLTLTGAELQLANDTGLAFNRPTIITANTQITSDRTAAGAGVTHTLGTLSVGAQTLTIAPGASSTSGTAGVAFGATTLTGAAVFAVNTGAGLTLGATDIVSHLLTVSGAGATTIAEVSSAGAGALAMTGAGATNITNITTGGAASLAVTGAGLTTISGALSIGGSGFLLTGTGRALLSGASTFATGVTVNGGVLEATNNGALGTGATVVNNGATLELNLANSTYTASSLTANAGGRVAVRGVTTNSAVTLAGGILSTRSNDAGNFAGPVVLTADSSVALVSYSTPANNQSLTISGKLSGASALNVTGNAGNAGLKALILTNPANDFSGVFNVTAGLRLSSLPAVTGSTLGTAALNLTGGFLRLSDNGTGSDGTLSYGNNLTVGTGGGTLDLDRVNGNNTGNTFALGGLSIGNATLAINQGANGYKISFTGGTLTSAATINHTGSVAIGGAVTGGFGLTKGGAGTLTLGGSNTYSGATSITAGSLNLTGSIAAGLFLGASTTLAGSGSVAGTAAVGNAATIDAGHTGSGTLTAGGLTFGTGAGDTATVNFTTNAIPANINVTAVGGLVANGAPGSVSLKLLSTLPAVGAHTIIDYAGTIGGTGFAAFALAPLPNPRIVASLVNNLAQSRIELDVTAVDAPRWSGAQSGVWSTGSFPALQNWNLIVGVGPTTYIQGDNVLFDDLATGSATVLLNVENVTPASVVFDNSTAKNYTLSGSNAIAGVTGLVKTNNGTLTISNTNSFTGAVSINGGTVSVNAVANGAAGSPLGAGTTVSINGGTLEFTGATGSSNRPVLAGAGGGTVKVSAASTLTLAGAITANGLFTLDNAGTVTVSGALGGAAGASVISAGTTTLTGNISTPIAVSGGGTTTISGNLAATSPLTKSGAGLAILTGASNVPSAMTVSAGILQVGDGVAPGSTGTGPITDDATLAFNTPGTFTVTVANGIGGTGSLTKTGAGTVVLSGAVANAFGGTTTVSGGSLILSKTSGLNAIGGNLVIEAGGLVVYGTTAGQLADHLPDTASITINGGTFGSGAGATLAAPTTGVADTVASVTVNSGSFLSGRGPGTTPAPFVVTGDFKLLGGTGLVQRGGALAAGAVQIAAPAVLDLDGGSGTANNQSRLNVGAGGLTLVGGTINFNAGPSIVLATSLGSIATLGGNVLSTGTSSLLRLNPTLASAFVDLGATERTFDVTGTLTIAPDVRNGGLRKTNAGTLVLTGTNLYADGTIIDGGTVNVSADAALGAAAGGVAINNGATLQAGGPITGSRAFTLGTGGAKLDTNGHPVTLSGSITGTTLTKLGNGTLTLTGTQTYATLTASNGTTEVQSALGTGASTVNANATVNFSTSQTLAALNIGGGAIVTFAQAPALAPVAAPEPGSALLALLGAGLLGLRRRRVVR